MQDLVVLNHLAKALFEAVLLIIHLGTIEGVIWAIDFLLGMLGQYLQQDNDIDIFGSFFVLFRVLFCTFDPNPQQ